MYNIKWCKTRWGSVPNTVHNLCDELLTRLRDAHLGCHIGSLFCGALGYADDVVILAPTLYSLMAMLDICSQFAECYDVKFNSTKSKLLYFGKNIRDPPEVPISFMGDTIVYVSREKHLGNIIGLDCNKYQINDGLNIFNSRVNMVRSHFGHTQHEVLYDIFKTYCMPLYGSQLWNYDCKYIDKLYVGWRKAIRKLLHLPYRTHCDMLPYIYDDLNASTQLLHRVVSFIKSVSTSQNLMTNMCYNLIMIGSRSNVSNSISIISAIWNTPRHQIINIKHNLSPVSHDENIAINSSVIRDMLEFRFMNKFCPNNCIFDREQIELIIHCLCTE